MTLIEETSVPDSALPVEEFRAHLHLGTGFGDEALQDPVLHSFLRAALAAIEARTGKVLFERTFLWTLSEWEERDKQAFSVAPVAELNRVTVVDRDGSEAIRELATMRLVRNVQQPLLIALTPTLPNIPYGGTVEVRFKAGWGTAWSDLPPDLCQAVLLLAAHYYEFRSETTLSEGCMPFGVSSLIERYKTVRIGFGGGK
ncbi:MAG: head-tail connector protein [Paracoccaceae bacterium]